MGYCTLGYGECRCVSEVSLCPNWVDDPSWPPVAETKRVDTKEKWRDIKTAPRDKTVFIAKTPKGVCRCQWTTVDWGEHPLDRTHQWWSNPDDEFWFEEPGDEPTHWIPEPEQN